MKKKPDLKKTALLSLFLTFAVILGYVDALLPLRLFPIAGLKLGLSNLAILLALELFSLKEAALISLLRILVVHLLLFPSPNGLILSLCGGTLSLLGMALFKRLRFPTPSVSVIGGILHNLGQVLIAVLLLKTPALLSCLFWLLPTGALCGGLIGILAAMSVRIIKKAPYFKDAL